MVLVKRDETPIEGRGVIATWVETLRSACVTLDTTPPGVIAAISVTIPLDGSTDAAQVLEILSKRFAEEHGLQVQVRTDGCSATVRFSRSEGTEQQ